MIRHKHFLVLHQHYPEEARIRDLNPNKRSWSKNDHAARFILVARELAIQAESDWDLLDEEWDVAVLYSILYELLLFLVRLYLRQTSES